MKTRRLMVGLLLVFPVYCAVFVAAYFQEKEGSIGYTDTDEP